MAVGKVLEGDYIREDITAQLGFINLQANFVSRVLTWTITHSNSHNQNDEQQ